MSRNLNIQKAVSRGLRVLRKPEPLRLSEWGAEHFYLSPESSYVEGKWEAFPFQIAIMDCMSNDDIREVDFTKSARVGATKMMLCAMGYFAEHKLRNQAIFQPVDDDADEFVKTELDPMLRDVKAVRDIFPWYDQKHKNNTMRQKVFTSKNLHIRGGKAGKNYRRISVDVVYMDELDGFDRDVEKEGDPVTLASKRIEGATFPKLILASTPKITATSMIEARANNADYLFRFHIECPHCEHEQHLKWGGPDMEFGFKWLDNEPSTVQYMCEDCFAIFTQDQYLEQWDEGRWISDEGVWIDDEGFFRDADAERVDTPLSVAFHIWTAYSPMTSWTQIVREFLAAKNDPSTLKTFVNTTLGESWNEDDSEKVDGDALINRREHYHADVPDETRLITFGVDTQDDRFEIQWDAWGSGEERWTFHYQRLYGDPSRPEIWDRLAEALHKKFKKADGTIVSAQLGCMDHGGHYGDEVNKFSKRMGVHFLIPVKGSSIYGKQVATFPRKKNDKGVYLTMIGTDTAKDVMFFRLKIQNKGPGYWHFPLKPEFDEEYFKQLTAEERETKIVSGGKKIVWDAKGRRNEPWDCSGYSFAACRIAQQHFGVVLEAEPTETPTPKKGRRQISKGVKV